MQWKRGIGGLVLAGAVVVGVLSGPAATAAADGGLVLIPEVDSSQVANDGCTFSSVGGSCSDPGPVGRAWIAIVNWFKSATGSSDPVF